MFRSCVPGQASARVIPTGWPSWSWTSQRVKCRIPPQARIRTQQPSRSDGSGGEREVRREPKACLRRGDLKSPNLRQRHAGRAIGDMTINIALATSDAVILGCDSIASTTQYFLDPFDLEWEKGADGKHAKDGDGKFRLKFDYSDYQAVVTNAWGGVTKLFAIHPRPTPVAAVTAGLAKLNDRPIASLAVEFMAKHEKRQKKLVGCEVICKSFLEFLRAEYDRHYEKSPLPAALREGPELLLGGFGRDDDFPSIFRIDVQGNKYWKHFAGDGDDSPTGLAWNGQSDAVERFIRGYDGELKHYVEGKIAAELKAHSENVKRYFADTVNGVLDKLKQKMPDGISVDVPDLTSIEIDWEQYRTPLSYSSLPRQEAINFVAFLVNLQSGKSRFARGVATVGGRTHIAVITKEKGFALLNEPELTHKHTGLGDDQ